MLRYRTGVAGSTAAGAATAKYLTSETFKPENADLARYYAGESIPAGKVDGMVQLGASIASGDADYAAAFDELVRAYMHVVGLPDGVEDIQSYVAGIEVSVEHRLL